MPPSPPAHFSTMKGILKIGSLNCKTLHHQSLYSNISQHAIFQTFQNGPELRQFLYPKYLVTLTCTPKASAWAWNKYGLLRTELRVIPI